MTWLRTAAVFLGLAIAGSEELRPVAEAPAREAAAPGRPERPLAERAEFPPQAEPSAPARARRGTAGEPREPGRPESSWVYDNAGRLRTVGRAAGTTNVPGTTNGVGWYAYTYDGPDPVEQWEGNEGTGLKVARWSYDRLGRTVSKDVLNRDASANHAPVFDAYTWTWDGDWKGVRSAVSDPSGTVSYAYEPSEAFGGLGHLSGVTRQWTSGATASFSYTHDFVGNEVSATWPSGATVSSDYAPSGWLLSQDLESSTGATSTVDYRYDAYGLPSGFVGFTPALYQVTQQRATPTRLDSLLWVRPNAAAQQVAYTWTSGGLLDQRSVSGFPVVDYGYDALRRVARVELLGTSRYEAFTYDRANNVTSLTRPGEGTWLYDRATFSEVPQRNRPGTQSFGIKVGLDDLTDTQQWEQGRLTSIASVIRGKRMDVKGGTVKPFLAKSTQTFGYDGAGRLVRSTIGTGVSTYGYDVDDAIVYETGGSQPIHRFQGYRQSGVDTVEKLTANVSVRNGAFVWTLVEPDGHALATYDDAGNQRSFEVLGAYGAPLSTNLNVSDWPVDGFHGSDPDKDDKVVHFGARHMLARGDGTWMQAEPYLYLGPTNGDLTRPLGFGGVYARANPNTTTDTTGLAPPPDPMFEQPRYSEYLACCAGLSLEEVQGSNMAYAESMFQHGLDAPAAGLRGSQRTRVTVPEPLESSPGPSSASRQGSSVGARHLGEAVAEEMGDNAGQFGRCVECATAAQKHLSDAGLSGVRVRIESKGPIGTRLADGTWTRVEWNGVHEYVESGGIIYDNLHPTGVPASPAPFATDAIPKITTESF